MRGGKVVNRNDMERTDGDRELIFADDDDHLWRKGNEIPVRNGKAASVGQAQGKRHEAILKPSSNLLNHTRMVVA